MPICGPIPRGLDFALLAAYLGWRVFPLTEGNTPFSREEVAFDFSIDPNGSSGVHLATTDPTKIRTFWSGNRTNARIGLAMGNGRMAIDCDEKNGKSGSATMLANGWTVPATASQRTKSGGAHYIYKTPQNGHAPTDVNILGIGLDRRGDGGYVTLYDPAVLTMVVSEAPEWSLSGSRRSGSDRKTLGSLPAQSFGDGVSALYSIDPNDLDFDQWIAISAAFRQATTGLVSDDMVRIAWDGWCNRYKEGNGNDYAENERQWQSFNNGTTVGWEYLRDHASSHVRASLIFRGYDFTAHLSNQTNKSPRSLDATNFFIRASQMEYRPPEYHIDGLIEKDSLTVLFGDPGTGKSFVALDMACCVATGHNFARHQTRQGSVFYIAGEGRNGLKRRVDAWTKHNDMPSGDPPLFISRTAARFLNRESAEIVATAIDLLATHNGVPNLIIIDTLNRNFGDGDENSQKDMTAFINAMDDLRCNFPDCTIIIVHHSGHGDKDRARGSSVLKGAVDVEYRITKTDDRITLENFKMKDGPHPKPMEFRLESIGYSAALTYLGEPSGRSSSTLTPVEQLVWEALNECKGDRISLIQWRDCFFSKRPSNTNETNHKAFKRAIIRLTELNFVVTDDDGKNYHIVQR